MKKTVDDVIDRISDAIAAGDGADVESYVAKFPRWESEIREAFPGILAMLELGLFEKTETENVDQAESLPGRTLGDFRIIREIGRGGMGIVYEAEQLSLERRVALKVLPLVSVLSPNQLQRFKNEARAAATLKHPNIVGVYSVGVERGVHYYAMELVEGHSLADSIVEMRGVGKSAEKITPSADTTPIAALSTQHTHQPQEYFRHSARLIADAADALDFAHERGIVHRDVKPANLLIDDQSHIWITDFGLAQLESDAGGTVTGDILGTLRYMSPEQASGKPAVIDFRTDIHALGATLFELLTHRCPFQTNDRAALLRQIAEDSPPSLCQIDSRIPKDLDTIVGKALEKDPVDRYQSAASMASDLRAFIDSRPIAARPPSVALRARKWTKRHSKSVAAAVLLLFLAVLGLTASTLLINRQRAVALHNANTAKHNAETAKKNASKADDNFQLALSMLEETLAESVAGNLVVEYIDPKHEELGRRGIEFYKQLAKRNNVDPETWTTYRLLVCIQQLKKATSLREKDPVLAEDAYLRALSLANELHAEKQDDPRYLAKLINCLDEYAVYLESSKRHDEAESQSQRAATLAKKLLESHPDFRPANYLIGTNHYNAGVRRQERGRSEAAEEKYIIALDYLEKAFRAEPLEERHIFRLAQCQYNLGLVYGRRGETI